LWALRDEQGSPYDGIVVEYTDPVSGDSVVPTMSFRAQMLRAGESTRTHRHPSQTVHCVFDGKGYTEVDGERLEWGRNDFFVIPGWMWHRHVNLDAHNPAFIYSVTDRPIHDKLGFYREQERTETGEIVDIVRWPRDG
jgi:gentisate 1,2-dioxygenase